MTDAHIAVADKDHQKIPGSKVTVFDRTTGIMVGSTIADSDGVADIQWWGTPFGGYRADAVTPDGFRGSVDFNLDFWANAGTIFINIPESDEGSTTADIYAWWNGLGPIGQTAVVGGGLLLGYLLFTSLLGSKQPSIIVSSGRYEKAARM